MNIIVTGATGMVGAEIVRQAIADPQITQITAISRKPLELQHTKLRVVLLDNFLDYTPIQQQLQSHAACLWCLGVSQKDVDEAQYRKITFDFTRAGADAMLQANPKLNFCFLSGSGAGARSPFLFGRVKYQAERYLQQLNFARLSIFRPGYIEPTVPRRQSRFEERLFNPITGLLYRLAPALLISSADLARAMLHIAKHGSSDVILGNRALQRMANELKA